MPSRRKAKATHKTVRGKQVGSKGLLHHMPFDVLLEVRPQLGRIFTE